MNLNLAPMFHPKPKVKRIINDWKPETRSLLTSLEKAGFVIHSCNNGESRKDYMREGHTLAQFLEELLACDEASLYVINPNGKKLWIYLVLGNEPGVITSDYTCDDGLDAVTDAHCAKWENRTQPTEEIESKY